MKYVKLITLVILLAACVPAFGTAAEDVAVQITQAAETSLAMEETPTVMGVSPTVTFESPMPNTSESMEDFGAQTAAVEATQSAIPSETATLSPSQTPWATITPVSGFAMETVPDPIIVDDTFLGQIEPLERTKDCMLQTGLQTRPDMVDGAVFQFKNTTVYMSILGGNIDFQLAEAYVNSLESFNNHFILRGNTTTIEVCIDDTGVYSSKTE